MENANFEYIKTVVQSSRSVREFNSTLSTSEKTIQQILELALQAPSSSNLQPWRFVWARTTASKNEIADICLSQEAAKSASDLIVLIARTDSAYTSYKLNLAHFERLDRKLYPLADRALAYYQKIVPRIYGFNRLTGLMDRISMPWRSFIRPTMNFPFGKKQLLHSAIKATSMAGQIILLATNASGYDCCPMEGFDERRLCQLLGLSKCETPIMIIAIGHKKEGLILNPRIRHGYDEVVTKI